MRLKIAFVVAALAGLMVGALPAWSAPRATLINVHRDYGKPTPSGANCTNDSTSNGLYTLTGWKVETDRTAHLNLATIPAGLSGVQATLQSAFDAWQQGTSAPRITVADDGTATRYGANRTDDLMFGRAGGSAIAVTYTWRWSDGFVESDVVFNKGVNWGQLGSDGDGCYELIPKYDLENIAAHEFGHVYGLGHPNNSDRFETMYAYGFTGETLKRSPENGDLNGMNQLY